MSQCRLFLCGLFVVVISARSLFVHPEPHAGARDAMSSDGGEKQKVWKRTGRKICAWTLQAVENPQRCARCSGIWYSSVEAHWSIHKRVC